MSFYFFPVFTETRPAKIGKRGGVYKEKFNRISYKTKTGHIFIKKLIKRGKSAKGKNQTYYKTDFKKEGVFVPAEYKRDKE